MAAITWDDVTNLPNAAGLASVPVEAQTQILSYVNTDTPDPCNYDGEDGTTTKLVRCLIAAHFGKIGPRWGFVSSESEDDLSKSWQMPPNLPTDAAFWMSTGWGMAYWNMRASSLARLPWVLC